MKYIFIDIDGTLYDHKVQAIPQSAVTAVEGAKRAGHKIFICTGRSRCQLEHVIGLEYDGVICSAGAYIFADDRLLFEEHIDSADVNHILELCAKYNIICNLEGLDKVYVQPGVKEIFSKEIKKIPGAKNDFFDGACYLDISALCSESNILKITMFGRDCNSLLKLKEILGEKFNLVITTKELENAEHIVAELTLSGNNKASGIRKVIHYYNAAMEDTIAIGDSMNDIEMIMESNVGIAMGNADSKLKACADYITRDIGSNGIYHAFEKFQLLE